MNALSWALIAFPAYLLVRGKFVDYLKLAG